MIYFLIKMVSIEMHNSLKKYWIFKFTVKLYSSVVTIFLKFTIIHSLMAFFFINIVTATLLKKSIENVF